MWRLGTIAWVWAGCGSAEVAQPTTAQPPRAEVSLPEGSFVSEEYAFAIRPVAGWLVLTEAETRQIGLDAAVMLRTTDGSNRFLRVHVEPAPEPSLDEYVDTILQNPVFELQELRGRERIRFAGVDAVRLILTGFFAGMPVRAVDTMFLRDGYAYTLRAWGGHGDPEGLGFIAIHEAFTLIDRPIVENTRARRVEDEHGPGWRLSGGRFESLSGGFAVEPTENWAPLVGHGLRVMNAEADVGFELRSPRTYMLVFSERMPAGEQARGLAVVRDDTLASLGARSTTGRVRVPFADAHIELEQWEHAAFDYAYGARCVGERCFRLLAWSPRGLRDRVQRALSSAPRVRLLSDADRERLASALAAVGRHAVGGTFALHGDDFTDFREGVRLVARARDGWLVTTGEAAHVGLEDASVYLENRAAGLHGALVVFPLDAPMPAVEFDRIAREEFGDFLGAPQQTRFADRTAWVSDGVTDVGGLPMRYRMYTTVRANAGFELVFWGFPELVERGRSVLDGLARELSIGDRPLPEHYADGERFVDARLGYSLRPPVAPTNFVEATQPSIRSIASVRTWPMSSGGTVTILALHDLAGRDAATMQATFRTILAERIEGTEEPPASPRTTLGGRPCSHDAWRTSQGRSELMSMSADGLAIAMVFENATATERDAIADSFALVE